MDIIIDRTDNITLSIYPVRLHQILVNLLSNAIDACDTNISRIKNSKNILEKYVKISAKKVDEKIIITISDNGCGIPKDKLETLFTSPASTKSEGTGLGLITTKNIIENELRGNIFVESTEGVGTTFEIIIPNKG